MPEHRLRCYDYVNQPFARVREVLLSNAADIFTRATASASERERAIGTQLRARIGSLEVAAKVRVQVGPARDTQSSPLGYGITEFPLSWQAVSMPSLFPHMQATLSVYPLSATETQLDFEGTYDPPLGLLGDAIDAIAGHRIAEASVLRLLQDIAALLREQLAAPR